jgi:crotonobetainyl-CoA:carnitine CoA-transferase CaiB-like acyl-CoA transferase
LWPPEAPGDDPDEGESGGFVAITETEGALTGVRVLDLTGGLAGPVAGMLLADLGADVVKVYAPGGGPSPAEPGLHMWDRGKRPVVLDPGREASLLALDRLVEAADVVLVGTSRPAVRYTDLLDRGHAPGQPGCWIVMPPYLLGETPWAGDQESAGLLFAWLGHAWNQASYADVPVDCLYPVALYMQGIWAATVAVALLTGRQRGLDLAPLAVAGGAHGGQLVSPGTFAAGRDDPHIHRPGGPGGTLPNYRDYRCADGSWLFFGAFTNAFIRRGLDAIGAGWVLDDPRVGGEPGNLRVPKNLVWIARELEDIFVTRPRAEWLELLDAADVPAAPCAAPGSWLEHDQVAAMGLRLQARNDQGTDVVMPGPLIALSQTPVTVRGPAATVAPAIEDLQADWPQRPVTQRQGPQHPETRPAAGRPADGPQPPLSGLRVLDLGTIIAGPYAATLLGDLGADVIKIERPPSGDEFRVAHGGRGGASFTVFNRDQRSALLDLTAGPGRDAFDGLVGSADVVIDNYRVGVVDRLGIGPDQLAAVNPRIVSLSINAFGGQGPLRLRPGFDPVIQAMSGIMRAQGGLDEADSPAFLVVPINDVLAACLGALGVCAALFAARRLGRGQHVGVTLCAASCLLQSEYLVRFPGAPPVPAGGRDFAGPAPLDRLYQAADGWVRLAATGAQLGRLVAAGLAPDAPAPGGPDGDADLTAGIAALIGGLPAAEVLTRASAAGIAAVGARQVPELAADEQLIQHGLLTVIEQDAAGVARVGPGRWLEMPGLPPRPPGDAPDPGEHTEAVLREAAVAADRGVPAG